MRGGQSQICTKQSHLSRETIALVCRTSMFLTRLLTLQLPRFPEATILCADISGFTAWASIRQPSQVFTLLESIFKEFDTMANKRKVFKVRGRVIHALATNLVSKTLLIPCLVPLDRSKRLEIATSQWRASRSLARTMRWSCPGLPMIA